jgi:hypothetical protein
VTHSTVPSGVRNWDRVSGVKNLRAVRTQSCVGVLCVVSCVPREGKLSTSISTVQYENPLFVLYGLFFIAVLKYVLLYLYLCEVPVCTLVCRAGTVPGTTGVKFP